MLDYLNQTLGVDARIIGPWAEVDKFPLYLRNGKKYSMMQIDEIKCVLIETDEKNFSLSAFQKQLTKLPFKPEHIVLCFQRLDSRQRKALIEAKLPFIVPDSQVYLPFLGIVLQERKKLTKTVPEKLSAAAQLILLHLIYEPSGYVARKIDLAKQLDISAMNVTRAVQELMSLELVFVEKEGRCDYVSAAVNGKLLYKKALPYMIDPVQKRLYVRTKEQFAKFPLAGEYALSTRSMLNGPTNECRAMSRKEYKNLKEIEEVDPHWSISQDYIQLEVWKYDPKLLAVYNGVDVISLSLSLRETKDERVEQAVEEMMEGYSW